MEHNNYERMTVPTLKKIWRERGESELENLS